MPQKFQNMLKSFVLILCCLLFTKDFKNAPKTSKPVEIVCALFVLAIFTKNFENALKISKPGEIVFTNFVLVIFTKKR